MALQKKRIKTSEENDLKTKKKAKKSQGKKVIYIEIDDEITSVFDKINKLRFKKIYLVIPQRAILFQSAINLKILKRKAEDIEKEIFVITNDPNGFKLAQRIGLQVFDKLEGHEHPSLVNGKISDQNDITPLKASVNSLSEEAPSRRDEKKFSISELIRRAPGGLSILSKRNTIKNEGTGKKKKEQKSSLVLVAPNKKALFSLVGVSVLIFGLISYIALPGATLSLTPKSNVIEVTTNVTLADYDRNQAELDTRPPKMIPSYRVSTNIEKVFSYQATGKEFQGKNAQGKVLIKNTSSNDWPLIPRTRFQTADGLVFRIDRQIVVPGGSAANPGTFEVNVTADPLDAFDQPIGERGNLVEGTKFFLPALSADNQTKIFAESVGSFDGGETSATKFISADDTAAARAKMEVELRDAAEAELKAIIAQRNEEQSTNLQLLTGNNLVDLGEMDITIPQNIEGQKLESFDVKGTVTVSGIAYNQDELLTILNNELKVKKNPEKSLASVDENSITYKITENNTVAGKVTITPSIQGIEEFEISPKKENGERLIKKIKDQIVGKEIQEARDFIQGLPEIEKVEISTWPAWAPTIPSVPDNIKIEIRR
ncbi:MAG: hypothetical protein ACRCZE_02155 [Candidatus Altimarinota bacterium]